MGLRTQRALYCEGATMTLRELRYLVALADREHFGRAAADCHVSQPTMSTQIKKLEEYLGVTLIIRNARAFSLTPAGQGVVVKARRIVCEVDEILAGTRKARAPLVGPLGLGGIPTLAPYLLPHLLPLVKGRYPRLQLILQEDLTERLLARLRDHQIEAALLALPLAGDEFERMPLFEEPFWLACPPGHRLTQLNVITDADLFDERLLLLAEGHCLRGQALAACGRVMEDDEGTDDFRATSLETLCQLVAAGLGCTLLPALAAQLPAGLPPPYVVRLLRSPHAARRIGLLWRRGYARFSELALLGTLIRDNCPSGTHAVSVDLDGGRLPAGHA